MSTDSFKYIEVFREVHGRRGYIHVEESVLKLVWKLYFTKLRRMRAHGFGKNSLKEFIKNKFLLRNSNSRLELPVQGSLCLRVNKGHMVFDINQGTVVKVFDSSVQRFHIKREISWMLRLRNISSVPFIQRWNLRHHWYEMNYANGARGVILYRLSHVNYIKAYYDYMEPFIFQLITTQPPRLINAVEHAERVIASSKMNKLEESGVDEISAKEIRDFIDLQLERISSDGDNQIYLAVSHGDLNPGNIIWCEQGIVFVDWEDVKLRSLLHDLHNILIRVQVQSTSYADIDDAISAMRMRLIEQRPEIAESLLAAADVYRWLYYIEKICKIMNREITKKRLGDILRSVRYFEKYDSPRALNT